MYIRFLWAVAVLLAAVPAAGAQPDDNGLRTMLRYVVEDGETPGIVVGVIDADGSTRILSFGEAGPGAVFEIGSVTKTFTGTLLADMVTRGEVALDDPVAMHLPGSVRVPEFDGHAITLEDLATHHSGLPGAPDHNPADPWNPWSDWTLERLYDWLATHDLRRPPGTAYEYSNLGMGLLAHALAHAADQPIDALLAERVLEPLGMAQTGHALGGGGSAEALVPGHHLDDPVPLWTTTPAIAGAGGLRSSADDLLRYVSAHLDAAGGARTAPLGAAIQLAQEPRRPEGPGNERIGLGWITATANGRTLLRHSGGTGGFSAEIVLDPAPGTAVVLLANSGSWNDNLATDLIAPVPAARPAIAEVERTVLDRYPGLYESAAGLPLHIDLDAEGFLTGQVPNQIRFRLRATSDSTFYAERVPFTIGFRTDESGVTGLALGVSGRINEFRRVSDETLPSDVIAGNHAPPIEPDALPRYLGTYLVQAGDRSVEVRVWSEDGRLMGDAGGMLVSRLVPRGEHEFAPASDPTARVIFHFDGAADPAERVTIVQGGQRLTGERR